MRFESCIDQKRIPPGLSDAPDPDDWQDATALHSVAKRLSGLYVGLVSCF